MTWQVSNLYKLFAIGFVIFLVLEWIHLTSYRRSFQSRMSQRENTFWFYPCLPSCTYFTIFKIIRSRRNFYASNNFHHTMNFFSKICYMTPKCTCKEQQVKNVIFHDFLKVVLDVSITFLVLPRYRYLLGARGRKRTLPLAHTRLEWSPIWLQEISEIFTNHSTMSWRVARFQHKYFVKMKLHKSNFSRSQLTHMTSPSGKLSVWERYFDKNPKRWKKNFKTCSQNQCTR